MTKKKAAKLGKTDDRPLTKQEDIAVDKLLASIDDIPIPRERKPLKSAKERSHIIDVVRKVLSEYVGPYIIIGYDLSDGPFADFNCSKSPIERQATMALFEEVADDVLSPKMMFRSEIDDD